jgi:hypothetical protein
MHNPRWRQSYGLPALVHVTLRSLLAAPARYRAG